jgi:hypothetical protein
MELQKEFWDEFGSDLVIDSHGHVNFTPAGREKYSPLFAKWGYVLAHIRGADDFMRTLRRVQALEVEENNTKLMACLKDPRIPEKEKQFIRKVLGMLDAEGQPSSSSQASASGRRSRNAEAQPTQAATVVYVDFRLRKVTGQG